MPIQTKNPRIGRRWLAAGVLLAVGLLGATSRATADASTAAADGSCCAPGVAAVTAAAAPLASFVGFFDNYGQYMPRIHCLRRADGSPDWPWIGVLIALNSGVVVGYAKIFRFWRRSYLAEAPRDRNQKLMDLARIFMWCAICGYGFSIMMFWWPAYRLNAVALAVLNFFTWRFAGNLSGLRVSLGAFRLQRELQESLENRAAELEKLVTERTAELERARAAAIAADRAKTDFLAHMSHEVRTPLTAILGFSQILADRAPADEARRQQYLNIVRDNGQHLLNVINDVLDLARIEAGHCALERVECELPALLQDLKTLWSPKAAGKNLSLAVEVEPGVPNAIETDPTRLRQILFNLVGNAIKFTHAGGIRVVARSGSDPGRVRIDVIDTGIGLSSEQVGRLFERFAQGDAATSRQYGGSGLGLAISRQLAGLLGGTLTVESAPGRGATFTVDLPAAAHGERLAVASPVASLEANGTRLDGLCVLIADDVATNRDLLGLILAQAGARYEFACDGQIAVDMVRRSPRRYDLVLMDIQMPQLDGYGATSLLRGEGFARPIIAVTANSMANDRARCLAAGCDGYVTKPIDSEKLIALIARLTVPSPTTTAATATLAL